MIRYGEVPTISVKETSRFSKMRKSRLALNRRHLLFHNSYLIKTQDFWISLLISR